MMRIRNLLYGWLVLFLFVLAIAPVQGRQGIPRPVKIFYKNTGDALTDDYRTLFEEKFEENLFEHPLLLQPVTTPERAEVIIWFHPEFDAKNVFTGTVYAGFQFPEVFPVAAKLKQLSTLLEPLPYANEINLGSDPEIAADLATALYYYGQGNCTQMEQYLVPVDSNEAAVNARLQFFQANCALMNSEYEKAISLFELALYDDGDDVFTNVAINLAWTYLELDQPEATFKLMDRLVGQSSPDPELQAYILAKRAELHALNFDYDAGLTDMNAAIELAPTNPALYVQRGQIYLLLYQWDNVLADYDRALQIDPNYADAYFYRGVLYYTIVVDRDKALPDFERYLELEPDGIHADEAEQYQADIQAQLEALNN